MMPDGDNREPDSNHNTQGHNAGDLRAPSLGTSP